MVKKSFYFIRHGETDWNKNHLFQGPNDIPLNQDGLAQVEKRARSLALDELTEIFTSPLLRAKRTAEIILNNSANIKNIIEVADLIECQSEESGRYVLGLENVTTMPSFENVKHISETAEDFLERVERGLSFVLSNSVDASPLIVSHGGVCTAICALLGLAVFRTPNCCMISFNYRNGKYSAYVK